ncbi:FecR family protein [Pseudoflavitalea rhizosphaerae]|uniref:FecR family protein n=1 Tax=Pseudoflavitalea rhizosphaerae TaxID=1884793 RepID=UPI0013E05275|nr:FecR family protein [Pseudoflavitalea rhizosphaerae]
MMFDPLLLAKLLHERLTGEISPEDSVRLEAWLELSAANRQFAKELEDEQRLGELLKRERADEEEEIEIKLMERAKSQIVFSKPVVPVRSSGNLLIRKWWWAAAAVVILAAGLYFWPLITETEKEKIVQKEAVDITPGRSGAILTLANGSQMSLDSVRNGIVTLEGGATAKVVDGKLIYNESTDRITYNTMSTPKGRIFQLTLPDGSNVWLNAASSIRYPTAFKGNQRRVEIKGEAYLEVARNPRMPFYVVLENNTELQVLGTSFNVNAYTNEENIKTTLIEGSIEVKPPQGIPKRLIPGEQAQLDGNTISVVNANVDQVIAWKNGVFDFTGKELKAALREVARWYDLEVVYEVEPASGEIVGKMQMNLALSQVMNILKGLEINYRIEGRRLIITK